MHTAALAIAAVVAGCSADVTRFEDPPAFGLSDSPSATGVGGTGGGSTFSQIEPSSAPYSGSPYKPAVTSNVRPVETAALSDAARVYDRAPDRQPPRTYNPPQQTPTPSFQPAASSGTITVVRGDTLYGLARRHGVTVNQLMATNQLTSSMLRPGQELMLPGNGRSAPARTAPARTVPPRTRTVASTPSSPPSDWSGNYAIEPGDSLYTIARKYGIKSSELQRYNGIDDPRRLRPGQVLKVPGQMGSGSTSRFASAGGSSAASRTSITQSDTAETAQRRIISAPRVMAPSSPQQPAILNGGSNQRVAALSPSNGGVTSDAAPTATAKVKTVNVRPPNLTTSTDTAKLGWPIRGKILSSFGQRNDGTHNDGVNIAAELGADVLAAEKGVVAYAGSELKGYGNLILIRHDNGWVTAYAHNDKLLVKRGDKVERGAVIAKAGKSGQVDKPQVHFELRQGAKPVDPLPFLARS
ncbi:MAG: LysM peptidoglycan-binding domain-containing protein [Pseudomonadota bacterium]